MSTMNLHVLFIQRKENYEGQYAPEALVVCDEYTMEENPQVFEKECAEALAKQGGVVASKVILVAVDQAEIRRQLLGIPKVKGTVVEPTARTTKDEVQRLYGELHSALVADSWDRARDVGGDLLTLLRKSDVMFRLDPFVLQGGSYVHAMLGEINQHLGGSR